MSVAILLFSDCFVVSLSLFSSLALFLCDLIVIFNGMVRLLYLLCVCYGFLLCGSHEASIKHWSLIIFLSVTHYILSVTVELQLHSKPLLWVPPLTFWMSPYLFLYCVFIKKIIETIATYHTFVLLAKLIIYQTTIL